MTLEEKIGQMTQLERSVATPEAISKYFIGKITLHFVATQI
jgi:beta-glucosidase